MVYKPLHIYLYTYTPRNRSFILNCQGVLTSKTECALTQPSFAWNATSSVGDFILYNCHKPWRRELWLEKNTAIDTWNSHEKFSAFYDEYHIVHHSLQVLIWLTLSDSLPLEVTTDKDYFNSQGDFTVRNLPSLAFGCKQTRRQWPIYDNYGETNGVYIRHSV